MFNQQYKKEDAPVNSSTRGAVFLPGTVFPVEDVGREGGRAFFDKVFFVSEHIMLSHIREITGLDAMALQNWVKRKWVPNPERK